MKFIRRTACLLLLALTVATAWPAHAAGPYTIKYGLGGSFSSGTALLKASKGPACADTVTQHPAQGVDSVILDARPYAGRVVHLDWSAEQRPAGGGVDANFFNSSCFEEIIGGASYVSRAPGRWTFFVPPASRWMVVSSSSVVNMSFHINLA